MKLTVIYDNEAKEGLNSGWGFSCLIESEEHNILFDTGWDGHVLLDNMKMLGLSLECIDILVLSHQHWDHIGGVPTFLNMKSDVDVFMPTSFSPNLKKEISTRGKQSGTSISLSKKGISMNPRLYEIKMPQEICKDVYTTGELGKEVKEQSLILDSGKGLYIITGCAHPGLSAILKAASSFGNVIGIIGGLHDSQEYDIFKGMQLIGAGHCTVHKEEIRTEYPDAFVDIFAGYSVEL
ncbi:MBL fold metallo-hydrolase [uncultured Methanomethylovorans sp.]|uniref:MBL fold metallo-hydrolase n=1 Tax=uncultured Methanomethylovorans sp. TaxID=183759 RepID=UPI002AA8FB97|nr:MBL fold metallo-hydrolase [uncultured Methanomethylovorans sp.]